MQNKRYRIPALNSGWCLIHQGYTNRSQSLALRESRRRRTNLPASQRRLGELGCVVLLTDVCHEEYLQFISACVIEKLPRLLIGQVAERTAHPGFNREWIRAFRQHPGVVVKLEHQGIAIGECLHYMGRDGTEVGKDTQLDCTSLQAELHGLTRIMGHRLGAIRQSLHQNGLRADDHTLIQPFEFGATRSARGQENGDFVVA